MRTAVSASIFTMIALAACQSTGDDAGDLADLVNAPAAGAQNQLRLRGYAFTQQQGSTTYWWNPRTTICATTVTSNGKYQTIGTATARYCGQQ